MNSLRRLRDMSGHTWDLLRIRLSSQEELTIMAGLGLLSGLLTGVVMLAFRLAVESAQRQLIPGAGTENFEALEPILRLLLCMGGGLTVGLLFQAARARLREVGVVHVMERLAYHQGHLPLGNAVMQFLGAAISLMMYRSSPASWVGSVSAPASRGGAAISLISGSPVPASDAAGHTPLAAISCSLLEPSLSASS